MTGDCNLSCSYCYQRRDKLYLSWAAAKKAVDFFLPLLTRDGCINFYGGEPLLAADRIRDIVDYVQAKSEKSPAPVEYSLTTNGTLLTEEMLCFLNAHKFSLLLSFDGYAQEYPENEKGGMQKYISLVKQILSYPDISLSTNSVFTIQTVNQMAESIQFIVELGVPSVNISFSQLPRWGERPLQILKKQLAALRQFSQKVYKRTQSVPVVNFRENPQELVFGCFAGSDRMAISPDGDLWGCCLISDYFYGRRETKGYNLYCFGSLDSFIKNHQQVYPEILKNYSFLSMDRFFTHGNFCAHCEDLYDCVVCPVDTMLGDTMVGMIPGWVCRIRKIVREEKRLFAKNISISA